MSKKQQPAKSPLLLANKQPDDSGALLVQIAKDVEGLSGSLKLVSKTVVAMEDLLAERPAVAAPAPAPKETPLTLTDKILTKRVSECTDHFTPHNCKPNAPLVSHKRRCITSTTTPAREFLV